MIFGAGKRIGVHFIELVMSGQAKRREEERDSELCFTQFGS